METPKGWTKTTSGNSFALRREKVKLGITIIEFNKFNNIDDTTAIRPYLNRLFKSGWWNVFKYSPELEKWLIDNKIEHKVDYDD